MLAADGDTWWERVGQLARISTLTAIWAKGRIGGEYHIEKDIGRRQPWQRRWSTAAISTMRSMGRASQFFFTPGGKVGKEIARPVADALSSYFQVVVYDRRNTGASDLIIYRGKVGAGPVG